MAGVSHGNVLVADGDEPCEVLLANPGLIRHFGSGLQTAPRMALLIHHETAIQDQWEKQLCRKRNFFARALKEGESLKVISEGVITQDPDNEWKVHLEQDTREKCKLVI